MILAQLKTLKLSFFKTFFIVCITSESVRTGYHDLHTGTSCEEIAPTNVSSDSTWYEIPHGAKVYSS